MSWLSEWRPSGQARPGHARTKRSGEGWGGAINVKVNMPYRAVKCKGYYNKINNAKISREAAVAKIKSNIRNLCAARCGHIAGSEKGVRGIRERGGGHCHGRAAKLFMQRAKESSEINEASRYQLAYPCRPPSPQPVAAWKRLGSRFSQYFAVFFWAFFSLVSVSSSCCCCCCFSFLFFFFWSAAR